MEPVKFNVYYRDMKAKYRIEPYIMETIEIVPDEIPEGLTANECLFCDALGRAFAHAQKCGFEVRIVEEIENA